MQIAPPPPDLADRFTVIVDHDAEPVDWDAAIVRFLIKYIEGRSADPAAGLSIYNPGEIED